MRSNDRFGINISRNGLGSEAERDKSRPYAVRHMPTLSRFVEDTKLKGMFFSNAYYFWQKSKLLLAICAFTADK